MTYPDIFIPSRGRAKSLKTPYILPPKLQERTYVVVRSEEAEEYINADEERNFGFITMPRGFRGGLSETRQWILDNSDGSIHIQLDDDILSFNHKASIDKIGGLKKATSAQILKMFDEQIYWLTQHTGVGHCGLATRVTAARSMTPYLENGNIVQALFYDRSSIASAKARFNRVATSQDTDMNLQLLRAGFRNRVNVRYSFNSRPNGVSGGCAVYRNPDITERVGHDMERLHPGLVKMIPKVKNGQIYNSLRVSWKKAFEEST